VGSLGDSTLEDIQRTVRKILIFAEDTTHRKQMEEAISSMSRKLIESQEQERAQIGRELHDDINQRLAMLVLELEKLEQNPSEVREPSARTTKTDDRNLERRASVVPRVTLF
jgi:signal transduction histidine kinase